MKNILKFCMLKIDNYYLYCNQLNMIYLHLIISDLSLSEKNFKANFLKIIIKKSPLGYDLYNNDLLHIFIYYIFITYLACLLIYNFK